MLKRMLVPLVFVFAVLPVPAAEPTHDITPGDYATLATITEIAPSPNGRQVAFCLATWDKPDQPPKNDL